MYRNSMTKKLLAATVASWALAGISMETFGSGWDLWMPPDVETPDIRNERVNGHSGYWWIHQDPSRKFFSPFDAVRHQQKLSHHDAWLLNCPRIVSANMGPIGGSRYWHGETQVEGITTIAKYPELTYCKTNVHVYMGSAFLRYDNMGSACDHHIQMNDAVFIEATVKDNTGLGAAWLFWDTGGWAPSSESGMEEPWEESVPFFTSYEPDGGWDFYRRMQGTWSPELGIKGYVLGATPEDLRKYEPGIMRYAIFTEGENGMRMHEMGCVNVMGTPTE